MVEQKEPILAKSEFTFLLVKPSAVKEGLVPILRQRLIEAGLEVIQERYLTISRIIGEKLYSHLNGYSVKEDVIDHIVSGDSYIFVIYGNGVIPTVRDFLGNDARYGREPKGIRGRYSIDNIQNVAHAPDKIEEPIFQFQLIAPEITKNLLSNQLSDELWGFLYQ